MVRRIDTQVLLLSLGLSLTGAVRAQEKEVPDVQTIVNKANIVAYYQGDDGKATVHMVITSKQGQTREREFNIVRKDVADGGDQNYFVYFQRPPDVRRMAYMVQKHVGAGKDDDRWLYMPALDLVKRIAAGDKRTSFVGSDFLYEDVSGRSLDEDTHELVQTTDALYIVKNVPKNPDTVEFSYYTVAIDRKTFVPMKMEFYDKQGQPYRTIESKKVEVVQDFPTVTLSVVQDLKTGSKTEMTFNDVKYNLGIGDIFEERYLRRPPKEVTR
ncbi:MAG: outer membrane lipoprotein-sorting protein [Sedimentisphaerales bacterium]|nr:outer membrane lipoprotein-sorting protein [Sedimentisphaerales bacterium]